jgi:hypothetical protein
MVMDKYSHHFIVQNHPQRVKVEEGAMLLVMRAAIRAQDPIMGLRVAKAVSPMLRSAWKSG